MRFPGIVTLVIIHNGSRSLGGVEGFPIDGKPAVALEEILLEYSGR